MNSFQSDAPSCYYNPVQYHPPHETQSVGHDTIRRGFKRFASDTQSSVSPASISADTPTSLTADLIPSADRRIGLCPIAARPCHVSYQRDKVGNAANANHWRGQTDLHAKQWHGPGEEVGGWGIGSLQKCHSRNIHSDARCSSNVKGNLSPRDC